MSLKQSSFSDPTPLTQVLLRNGWWRRRRTSDETPPLPYWPPWTPTKMMIHFFLLSKDLMYILFSGQAVGKPKTWYLRSSHHVKEEDQAALVPKIITGGDLLQWQLPCCWWQLAPATDNTPFTVRTRSLCCRARCRRTRERHATAKSSTSNVRLERKSRFNLCNMDDPFRQLKWEFFCQS